jgi:hypothetical protein
LSNEPTPLRAFSALHVPVLYMMGSESPASSRGVGRLLTRVLPQVEVVEFEGLGHMGPVTHPQIVNAAISRFLDRQAPLLHRMRLLNSPDADDDFSRVAFSARNMEIPR